MININDAIERLNEVGIETTVTNVYKNGIEKVGISLGNGALKPTVYVDGFNNMDEFIDFCKDVLNDEKPEFDFEITADNLMDYDKIKDKMFVCLIGKDKIKDDILTDVAFEDLYKYLRIYVGENATIVVKKGLFDAWGVSMEQVFADALENSKKLMPALYGDLGNLFGFSQEQTPLYVVTNEKMYFGASVILYCDKLPNEFYMLPSSIHETLIIPIDKYSDEESNLADMVRAVNSTEVRPEDKLSDNAYYFNINTGWRTIFRKENRG